MIWVVFNGEIYNFIALRTELQRGGAVFRSRTDTEVLLHAYQRWGYTFVAKLRGMFAMALWDRRTRSLLLVRDRIGIKPLYYARLPDRGIIFASELKALLAHPRVARKLDSEAVLDYLTYGYVPYDRCIISGVHKLPAGHLLSFRNHHVEIDEYWHPNPAPNLHDSEDVRRQLHQSIAESVAEQMVSDVPLGVFLSGGLDSSVVTACAAAVGREPVRTFHVSFDTSDSERSFAADVARQHCTVHQEKQVALAEAMTLIENLAEIYDEPFADSSGIPTFLICREARPHVKVALSGDGADELFAGYLWQHRQARLRPPGPMLGALGRLAVALCTPVPWLTRSRALMQTLATDPLERYLAAIGYFDSWDQRRLVGPRLLDRLEGRDRGWLLRKFFSPELPLLTALQQVDLRSYLVDDILVKVDRASMANSLEVRPVFLDHRTVDLAFAIHPSLHLGAAGVGKDALRRAFSGQLPASVRMRGKRGFSVPLTNWFKQGLGAYAEERLLSGELVAQGWLRPNYIHWLVVSRTFKRWAKLWALLMFEEWYRRWIVGA